jgi:hypothetical protein
MACDPASHLPRPSPQRPSPQRPCYPLPVVAGAQVWQVNEPTRLRELQLRGSRRARRRGLSRAVSQVERSAEYRRSIGELHALASSFRHALDGSQQERWLVLEEALLAHSERLNRAYYHAGFRNGVEWGTRSRPAAGLGEHARLLLSRLLFAFARRCASARR